MKYGKGEVLGKDLMHEMHVVAFEGERELEKCRVCMCVCVWLYMCVVVYACVMVYMLRVIMCVWLCVGAEKMISSEGWKYG